MLQIPWILCYSFVAGTVDQSFSRCYGMCHHFEVYLLAESYILPGNNLLCLGRLFVNMSASVTGKLIFLSRAC